MKKIFLLRHAKSSWSDPTLEDLERPLNNRGRMNAPQLAKRAALKWKSPKKILCSPAKRAVQTAECMKIHWWKKQDYELDSLLYEQSAHSILDLLKGNHEEVDSIAFIFHNPTITILSNLLVKEVIHHIPTCGLLTIGLSQSRWNQLEPGCCELLDFDYPKKNP